jgi:hypothetical protein
MCYCNRVAQQLNPFGSGRLWGRQRHFEPVPVSLTYLPTSCQLATDTDSRCFYHVDGRRRAHSKNADRIVSVSGERSQSNNDGNSRALCMLAEEGKASGSSSNNSSTTRRAEPLARPCSFAFTPVVHNCEVTRQGENNGTGCGCTYIDYTTGDQPQDRNPHNQPGQSESRRITRPIETAYRLTHKRPFRRDADLHGLNKVASDAETGATQAEQIARAKSRRTHLKTVRPANP